MAVGIIEAGANAEWKHLLGHRNFERVYVIAVYGIDEGRARHFTGRNGI